MVDQSEFLVFYKATPDARALTGHSSVLPMPSDCFTHLQDATKGVGDAAFEAAVSQITHIGTQRLYLSLIHI